MMEGFVVLIVISVILLLCIVIWLGMYVEVDSKTEGLGFLVGFLGVGIIVLLWFSSYNYSYYNLKSSVESGKLELVKTGMKVEGIDTVNLYEIKQRDKR